MWLTQCFASPVFQGAGSKHFNATFDRAQEILRKSFGMEMAELMTRVERDKAFAPDQDSKKPKGMSHPLRLMFTLPQRRPLMSYVPCPC